MEVYNKYERALENQNIFIRNPILPVPWKTVSNKLRQKYEMVLLDHFRK